MKTSNKLKVGIIGLGAIGRKVTDHLISQETHKVEIISILCRDKEKHLRLNADQSESFKALITDDHKTFFDNQPDLVIEAAGQETLAQYGPEILQRGIDLLVSSIGLFTDDKIFQDFLEMAEKSGSKILLSSGALPAVDWMSAASLSQVSSVSITQSKPLTSWKNTPAEEFINLSEIEQPTCFFQGTARDAANIFPKSSNISAMLALATVGLDATKVKLVADPLHAEMHTDIEFDSEVGRIKTHWQGVPSSVTPSTSADVPLAIIKTIKNLTSTVRYGV